MTRESGNQLRGNIMLDQLLKEEILRRLLGFCVKAIADFVELEDFSYLLLFRIFF
ncbi:hypothetical protein RZS28_02455 [Methylocapsa polymorpha]|uniref:Uncharacterized protein n=1 Tax=Methylocapsa polymorpha TaxID=3080828 RepID=A0ABZ0HTR5_9HYPH|nr:hypothetical protein RZS28_02455 [Methylocapsa sp. RX1]